MNIVELAQGVFVLTPTEPRFGDSNIGLIIDPDGLTVIDSSATRHQGELAKHKINELTASLGLPIKRVVLTSSQIVFSGGGRAFDSAAFFGSEATSDQLDMPANPQVFRALLPHLANHFDDDLTVRPITHIVSEPAQLTPSLQVFPLVGESAGSLAARVEQANIVFLGASASFGVVPLAHQSNFSAWLATLQKLGDEATTFVPGHGTPGSSADLNSFCDYLVACLEAKGVLEDLRSGWWTDSEDFRLHAVNVERAYLQSMGSEEIPGSMLTLVGLTR